MQIKSPFQMPVILHNTACTGNWNTTATIVSMQCTAVKHTEVKHTYYRVYLSPQNAIFTGCDIS